MHFYSIWQIVLDENYNIYSEIIIIVYIKYIAMIKCSIDQFELVNVIDVQTVSAMMY